MKKVVIVGGGFGGINVARKLGNAKGVAVTLIDKRNHHLFQPLLYQVAMAAVSPADIASPIRSVLRGYKNIEVRMGTALDVKFKTNQIVCDFGTLDFDYLVLACGASHSYFGHDEWENFAPGLKSLEEATEIRRRVLTAFERAEHEPDPEKQKQFLTFVVVGAGPTGVELAGALGEISRYTLSKDFRNVNPKRTRIFLIEGSDRVLPTFDPKNSEKAARALEGLGVSIYTNSLVTNIDGAGVKIGQEVIKSSTVLWAAGVKPADINTKLALPLGPGGRIIVEPDLSLAKNNNIFVIGDQANFSHGLKRALPGVAPVAIQQGRHVALTILGDLHSKPRAEFKYLDKGTMATIGKNYAVAETGGRRFSGIIAWWAWLFVHIFYLIGFRNKVFVLMQWAWSYVTFRRGARLITNREWRSFGLEATTAKAKPKKAAKRKVAGKKKTTAGRKSKR